MAPISEPSYPFMHEFRVARRQMPYSINMRRVHGRTGVVCSTEVRTTGATAVMAASSCSPEDFSTVIVNNLARSGATERWPWLGSVEGWRPAQSKSFLIYPFLPSGDLSCIYQISEAGKFALAGAARRDLGNYCEMQRTGHIPGQNARNIAPMPYATSLQLGGS